MSVQLRSKMWVDACVSTRQQLLYLIIVIWLNIGSRTRLTRGWREMYDFWVCVGSYLNSWIFINTKLAWPYFVVTNDTHVYRNIQTKNRRCCCAPLRFCLQPTTKVQKSAAPVQSVVRVWEKCLYKKSINTIKHAHLYYSLHSQNKLERNRRCNWEILNLT